MTELYIGIHHVMDDVAGAAIVMGTQAALKGGWILGTRYPATHAFVVVGSDGLLWRLDGKPSRAEWSPFVHGHGPPRALWRIKGDQAAINRGVVRARSITHAAYDWTEITAATAAAFSVLPFAHRLRNLGRMDLCSTAMICTQVARQTLIAVENYAELSAMPDLYPERLGQVLHDAESTWTERWLG